MRGILVRAYRMHHYDVKCDVIGQYYYFRTHHSDACNRYGLIPPLLLYWFCSTCRQVHISHSIRSRSSLSSEKIVLYSNRFNFILVKNKILLHAYLIPSRILRLRNVVEGEGGLEALTKTALPSPPSLIKQKQIKGIKIFE